MKTNDERVDNRNEVTDKCTKNLIMTVGTGTEP